MVKESAGTGNFRCTDHNRVDIKQDLKVAGPWLAEVQCTRLITFAAKLHRCTAASQS